jgi:hypothetical protein
VIARVVVAIAVASSVALAGPVDPQKLPVIVTKPGGTGDQVQLWAAKVPVEWLLRFVERENYVTAAGASTIEGKIDPAARASTIAAALRAQLKVTAIPNGAPATAVDVDFVGAPPRDLLRFLADMQRVDLVIVARKDLPRISVRTKRGNPLVLAREIAKLAGVTLIEKPGVWIVVEPGMKLDLARHKRTVPGLKININEATPGEVGLLLDANAGPGKCPAAPLIEARLKRGQVGILEAIIATLDGPACSVAVVPKDMTSSKLIAIARGPKVQQALFRHAKGASIFTPAKPADLGDNFVMLDPKLAVELYTARPVPAIQEPCSKDFKLALRAVVRVGTTWSAIFADGADYAKSLDSKRDAGFTFEPGRVTCPGNGPTYVLTAP